MKTLPVALRCWAGPGKLQRGAIAKGVSSIFLPVSLANTSSYAARPTWMTGFTRQFTPCHGSTLSRSSCSELTCAYEQNRHQHCLFCSISDLFLLAHVDYKNTDLKIGIFTLVSFYTTALVGVFARGRNYFGAHKVTVVEPDVLHGLYQLLSNYDTYRDSLEGLKQTLRNLIKPDSVLSNSFI